MKQIIFNNGKIDNLEELMQDSEWYTHCCRECGSRNQSDRYCVSEYEGVKFNISETHFDIFDPVEINISLFEIEEDENGNWYQNVENENKKLIKKTDIDICFNYDVSTPYWRYNGKTYNRPNLENFSPNPVV